MAASGGVLVGDGGVDGDWGGRTLLLGLVLFLVGCEEHVVREGAAGDGALGTHGVRFAR